MLFAFLAFNEVVHTMAIRMATIAPDTGQAWGEFIAQALFGAAAVYAAAQAKLAKSEAGASRVEVSAMAERATTNGNSGGAIGKSVDELHSKVNEVMRVLGSVATLSRDTHRSLQTHLDEHANGPVPTLADIEAKLTD